MGTLELTGVPFTGCRAWPTTVCHRKHVANTLLSPLGFRCPPLPWPRPTRLRPSFPCPAIVKPAAEDASVGIDNGAVCTSKRALKRRVAQMLEQFDEVLVQEYVAGREFNVGFVGKRMLPIAEIRFDDLPEGTWPIVSYAAKWIPGSPEDEGTLPVCPAEFADELRQRIAQVARTPGSRWPTAKATAGSICAERGRPALCPRGQPLPRSLEQRRPGPNGPRLWLELRRPGHADRG